MNASPLLPIVDTPVGLPSANDHEESLLVPAVVKALDALSLSGFHLPEQGELDHSFFVCGADGQGHGFFVRSPDQTGKTPESLVRLFNEDMRQDWPLYFDHLVFEVNHDVSLFEALPFYCHENGLTKSRLIPSGIRKHGSWTEYFLFFANERERHTSFLEFNLYLQSTHNLLHDFMELSEDDVRTLELTIDLKDIFTRCRFRGRGAASAMAEAVGLVVHNEILHLSKEMLPFFNETGIQSRLAINLEGLWRSKTGVMAHEKVFAEIKDMVNFHKNLQTEVPELQVFEVLDVNDDSAEYA